jgi:hypothetical protein
MGDLISSTGRHVAFASLRHATAVNHTLNSTRNTGHVHQNLFSCVTLPCCLQTFPGSDWVTSSAALAHYNCRNFDTAQALYEDLLERDPWRLQVGVQQVY